MTNQLDLSLPEKKHHAERTPRALLPVSLLILVAVAANMFFLLRSFNGQPAAQRSASLSAQSQKQLALKLEKQGLNNAAAVAWKQYLDASAPADDEAARIWYRIGTLFQKESDYEKALDGFYRSESFAGLEELAPDISRRTQECLEAMGKFTALRYELAERVGLQKPDAGDQNAAAGATVVAEIGPQKITQSDLDGWIESRIESQLSQMAPYLPEDKIRQQKEKLLKQLSTTSQRRSLLNQLVLEEILYRKARESKLMDDPGVRAEIRKQEHALLAAKVIEKQFADKINITDGDLATYYEAHKQEYMSPATAAISYILVADQEHAGQVRKQLNGGMAFAEAAEKFSLDEATGKDGGQIKTRLANNPQTYIPGIGYSDEALQLIFATRKGQVVAKDLQTEKGVYIIKVREKQPAQQKSFDDAHNEVFQALRAAKEREVQENLFQKLKQKYDVVIHHAAMMPKQTARRQAADNATSAGGPDPH